jgi:hypothetical protein
MFTAAFEPFLKQSPLCLLVRLTLENLFSRVRLDTLFRKVAKRQYQKELLFSEVVELMMSVVLRVRPSVNAAYRACQDSATPLKVADQSVYNKLQCMELGVSEALVNDSAQQLRPVIDALGARLPAWLPGYHARIIDGNHLSATQRRLKVLRGTWAASLPGKVLAIYDQEYDLVTDVVLTPDGHAQERSLLDRVLLLVKLNDLWIADRNFCTLKFLFGIEAKGGVFVIRQHGCLVGRAIGQRRRRGRTDTGYVYEHILELDYDGQTLRVRCVTLVLDEPTRDGETEIRILTNLPHQKATAVQVADIYRKRWTIEGRFYEVTQTLDCEPDTLGYPKAALFAFCLALVASNAVALLKASLRAVHGAEKVAEMSHYYMALEIRGTYLGMMIALPPPLWQRFRDLSAAELAAWLRAVAGQVSMKRYVKAHRGPKKPPPKRGRYKNGGHVSTYKRLKESRK